MKSFTAGPNENDVRLSRFVEGVTHQLPRSMMYKAFRNKRIKVNGKRAEPDTRLRTGDVIELYINDEFFPAHPSTPKPKAPRKQPPVTIIYEDENFAVLYKPAHLLCHSDRTGDPNLVDAFSGYGFFDDKVPLIAGAALALVTAVCVFGGGRRLSRVTGVLVPVMGGAYVLVALMMIVLHIDLLPGVLAAIFRNAFDFRAIFGGFTGSAMMYGVKRGLFSNEAGVGSAPNAAAAASVSHPVKQGLAQMLSVFLDTLIICSATAFLCLCSGVEPQKALKGVPYVQAALAGTFGSFGHWFITAATLLFAFTTILGNYYYCESNLQYLLRRDARWWELTVFRLVAVYIVFLGARMDFSLVWDTADVTMGCMALINLPAILLLAKPALLALKDYQRQRREGKDPVFRAADIGLAGKTEFWQ